MAIKNKKIENAKIIKHKPPSAFKYSNTNKIFKLKASSPFMSSVKQIQKKLSQIEKSIVLANARNKGANIVKEKYLTVVGLQKVIPKLLQVACYFQERHHRVEILTKTVNTIDEFQIRNSSQPSQGAVDRNCDTGEIVEATSSCLINDSGSEEEEEEEVEESLIRKRSIAGLELKIHISSV
ncbi:hypothetical protein DASC09_024870 [Saccharomycopsis crataegensis]|uniref:Uncharacterized protein n=1 Tax=Saccharomycopsis crataegensis TaxID=43959 RepID=A0AAV5QKL9_9ASCO|nr:hypothetical protein DASC09_024870 [Saccharomycopsis crataegensis]